MLNHMKCRLTTSTSSVPACEVIACDMVGPNDVIVCIPRTIYLHYDTELCGLHKTFSADHALACHRHH